MLFDKTSDIRIKYSTKGCIFCEGMAGGLEQKRMFRTSLSGFHKDDVNRYIAELSKKIEESSACCQQAQSELEALRNERNEAQKDREELKKELEQTNARLEALQSGNDVLMEKAREHFEDRARASHEEQELRQRVAELEARIPELEERAKRYEKESLYIAQTLIGAREESERIVAAARDTASLVREQLRQEIARVAGAVDRMTSDYVDIREGTQRYSEQMRVMMESLFHELEVTRNHLTAIEVAPPEQADPQQETAPANGQV